jgi:ADP-heptose:LPS heptosyltransferase
MLNDQKVPDLKRIVIVRALSGLGDFLCAVPAWRSLRAAFPGTKIMLLGLPKIRSLVERYSHYLDDLWEFPGYPGLPEQIPQRQKIPGFLAEIQEQQFDLALQMQGSGTLTNPLTVLLGARMNAGFYKPGEYCPNENFFLPYLEHESEVRRYLRLLTFLGVPNQGEELEFPLSASDKVAFNAIAATHDLHAGEYVCIHPGASVIDRRWPLEAFAAVADHLVDRGFRVVITGSKEELPLTQSLNLAGCTDLGVLAGLLKGSRLLVCNDTGVSHLADALQVPSVVIFTHSQIDRWAPLDRTLHRVVEAQFVIPIVIEQIEALLQHAWMSSSRGHHKSETKIGTYSNEQIV